MPILPFPPTDEDGVMTYVGFELGKMVHIDGGDMKGVVTAVCFRVERTATYEVSYMHNGVQYQPWIEEYRLTLMK